MTEDLDTPALRRVGEATATALDRSEGTWHPDDAESMSLACWSDPDYRAAVLAWAMEEADKTPPPEEPDAEAP